MAKAKFKSKSKKPSAKIRVVGDVRQTQLITSYGVGSIVDFVKDTVIIAGVDDWDTGKNAESVESRKLFNENLQALTGAKFFLSPKTETNSGWFKSKDISAFPFPEILYCPKCKRFVTANEAANANPARPNKCCLSDEKTNQKCSGTLVASRFVVICENGHMEDFPYSWWIHEGESCSSGKPPRISMYNIGDRSDIESLWIECRNCGKRRSMAGAFAENALSGENGYLCSGNHPHIKNKHIPNEPECDKKLKTRLRSSSGIYYPVTMNALQIPPWSREAVKIIEKSYDDLILMGDNVKTSLQRKANSNVTFEQLLTAFDIVKLRKGTALPRCEPDIYQDEYNILSQGTMDNDEDDYSAYTAQIPNGFEPFFEQVTIVDKLTVIEALKGFTRLKPWGGDNDIDNANVKRIVPLSTYHKDWLPAVEFRGEGIFMRFREDALLDWQKNIGERYSKMAQELSESYFKSRQDRFSPIYVLLHTFAHLFIRQLANECGYSVASLKEKIYSTFVDSNNENVKMHGVLVYLASSDCDGSLGGLISVAQNPEKLKLVIENMLRKAQWCSADPLCIVSLDQGFHSLNYSACHDCVLLPETSCEFRNVLLDRVSIIGTAEQRSLGIMGAMAESLL